jgi:hypothetical protein
MLHADAPLRFVPALDRIATPFRKNRTAHAYVGGLSGRRFA